MSDPLIADAKSELLESWALIEIFGHDKIAGLVTTRKFGTQVMFQVDVPKTGGTGFAYSRLLSPGAIFAIQPTSEEWCRKWTAQAEEYGKKSPLPYIPEPRQIPAPSDDDGSDAECDPVDVEGSAP